MLHNLAAPAAATIVSVATGLNNGDISNLKVSPNFTFFPFMQLVSDMVGGLWALSLYIAVGAWICAAIAWIAGRVIHSGPAFPFLKEAGCHSSSRPSSRTLSTGCSNRWTTCAPNC